MRIFDNFMAMSWGQRLTILLLILAVIQNLRASLLQMIKAEWRWLYLYGTVVSAALVMYAVLLLAEVLERGEYATAVQWLSPLFVMRVVMEPSIHIWEEGALRSKIRGLDGTSPGDAGDRGSYDDHSVDIHKGESQE